METTEVTRKQIVAVRFTTVAQFDVLIELSDENIERLKADIGKEFVAGEAWNRLLLSQAGPANFDFVHRDEDIEIQSADILVNYPFTTKRVDL